MARQSWGGEQHRWIFRHQPVTRRNPLSFISSSFDWNVSSSVIGSVSAGAFAKCPFESVKPSLRMTVIFFISGNLLTVDHGFVTTTARIMSVSSSIVQLLRSLIVAKKRWSIGLKRAILCPFLATKAQSGSSVIPIMIEDVHYNWLPSMFTPSRGLWVRL